MKKYVSVLLVTVLALLCIPGFAAVGTDTAFDWNGFPLRVSEIRQGEAVEANGETAEGKFVQFVFVCEAQGLTFGDTANIEKHIALSDAQGTVYQPRSVWGTLAESVPMDQILTAKISAITALFDVPEDCEADALTLLVDEVPASGGADLPDELVGVWSGSGEPVGGGSAISLTATVGKDGSGSYEFSQAGYTESYPITLSSADGRFQAAIPEDNKLGIVGCEGTYALEEGALTLRITTTFAGGRTYKYAARCEKIAPDADR